MVWDRSVDEGSNTGKDAGSDRALLLGELPGARGVAVLRQRADDAPIEAGVVRPMRDGEPIVGELVSLEPTPANPRVCSVKVHHDARPAAADPAKSAPHKGPARVASDAYRAGWDEIFGKTGEDRSARTLN